MTMLTFRDEKQHRAIPHRVLAMVCGTLVLSSAAGCGVTHQSVPYGLWEGHGTVVYEVWKPDAAGSQPQRICREYATSLHIEPRQLGGQEIIYLRIHSRRGALPDLQDETRLEVALQKDHQPTTNTTVYRIHSFLFNPEPSERIVPKSDAPLTACAVVNNGVVTLMIQYMENFVDILEFRGGTVRKTGMLYGDDDRGIVYWSEALASRGRPGAPVKADRMPTPR